LSDSLSELIAAASEPLASGEPRPLSIEGGERFAETLEALLRRKNGFYAFESALHVLPSGTGEDVMSLERWNAPDLWRHEYGDMTEGCFFFGEDVFGGQFCFRAGQVCTFDPETGDIEPLAPSLDAWAGEILRRYDNLTGHPLAHEWQRRHGALPRGHRLVPTIPFVAGGEYRVENLRAGESVASMRYRGDIAKQIRDLPDGTPIRLKVK